jgi:hypothetical protein
VITREASGQTARSGRIAEDVTKNGISQGAGLPPGAVMVAAALELQDGK